MDVSHNINCHSLSYSNIGPFTFNQYKTIILLFKYFIKIRQSASSILDVCPILSCPILSCYIYQLFKLSECNLVI